MKSGKIIFDKDVKVIGESAFEGLSSLTSITIPKSVQTIEDNAFKNCQNLSKVEYKGSLDDWRNIIKSTTSFDNVNTNIVECHDGEIHIIPPYLTFTAQQSNSTVGLGKLSTYQTLEYSYDKNSWSNMDASTIITLYNMGDKVYFRGILSGNNTYSNYTQFKMTGKIAASGNCNTIWNYKNINARLKSYCGFRMFDGCTSLTTAPELSAITLTLCCYNSMFDGCTSLTTAPELPATILAHSCYQNMFGNCTSLTTAPKLPATELADGCYYLMFQGCTSLTTAPKLPATTLVKQCYYIMFSGCTKLDSITCLAIHMPSDQYVGPPTGSWTYGVSLTGTFYKHPDATWSTGDDGIPNGWEVVDVDVS